MIELHYRDARPVYEQVQDGLRQLLVRGAILPGERLPSVRSLATNLSINPNTIQRAYEALEREGYVYTLLGKGTFAAERSDVKDERRDALLKQYDEIARELLFLGCTWEMLSERLKEGTSDGKA